VKAALQSSSKVSFLSLFFFLFVCSLKHTPLQFDFEAKIWIDMSFLISGKWNNSAVAVKKLRMSKDEIIGTSFDEDTLSKAFAEFRREVWIMSSLSHPCIVQLIGLLCYSPLRIHLVVFFFRYVLLS
jgi:serine/threonine protein kinase